MKKTITLLVIMMAFLNSEAFNSKLILRVPNARATLDINGQRFVTNNGEFVIHQLRQGRHFINLYSRQGRNHPNQRGNRNGHHRKNINQFRGKIFIPRESRVFARITPRGNLIIDQVVPIRRNRPQPRVGNGRDFGNDRDFRTAPRQYRDVPENRFGRVLQSVRNSDFERTKLAIAREYIFTNDITSSQVLRLMRVLNFESSRLSIAKLTYNRVIDPENYFLIYDGFEFQSSVDALNRFLNN